MELWALLGHLVRGLEAQVLCWLTVWFLRTSCREESLTLAVTAAEVNWTIMVETTCRIPE